jgi:hypothetical protein
VKTHDKIILAGELLVEAANECRSAKSDVGFAKSILLAGAVSLIITPWLKEIGIESMHVFLARRAAELSGKKMSAKELNAAIGKGIGYYRFAYNSLKHAGSKDVKASDDLFFEADLEEEANLLIDAVVFDYKRLPLSQEVVNTKLSSELLTLIQSSWEFPAFDVKR